MIKIRVTTKRNVGNKKNRPFMYEWQTAKRMSQVSYIYMLQIYVRDRIMMNWEKYEMNKMEEDWGQGEDKNGFDSRKIK